MREIERVLFRSVSRLQAMVGAFRPQRERVGGVELGQNRAVRARHMLSAAGTALNRALCRTGAARRQCGRKVSVVVTHRAEAGRTLERKRESERSYCREREKRQEETDSVETSNKKKRRKTGARGQPPAKAVVKQF